MKRIITLVLTLALLLCSIGTIDSLAKNNIFKLRSIKPATDKYYYIFEGKYKTQNIVKSVFVTSKRENMYEVRAHFTASRVGKKYRIKVHCKEIEVATFTFMFESGQCTKTLVKNKKHYPHDLKVVGKGNGVVRFRASHLSQRGYNWVMISLNGGKFSRHPLYSNMSNGLIWIGLSEGGHHYRAYLQGFEPNVRSAIVSFVF